MSQSRFSDRDHVNMGDFLGHVLDQYKADAITKVQAVEALAHVIAAVDIGNIDQARDWFERGRKYLQQGHAQDGPR